MKDDLTPGRAVDDDPLRQLFFRDDRVRATEILVTPAMAAVVAVRV